MLALALGRWPLALQLLHVLARCRSSCGAFDSRLGLSAGENLYGVGWVVRNRRHRLQSNCPASPGTRSMVDLKCCGSRIICRAFCSRPLTIPRPRSVSPPR